MQYLSWADQSIALCFVKGLSYAKRARVVEHRGGFVSSRGFEASEISVQVEVSRPVCMAFGLNFDEEVIKLRNLKADMKTPSGIVTIGGYVLYPELQFALTNINTSVAVDNAVGISIYGCDLVLSGVACSKEVCRARVLEFEPEIAVPVVSLRCKGKRLVIQDGNQITKLLSNPMGCDVEFMLGDDSKTASRKGFIDDVINEGGLIDVDYPFGVISYNIVTATLIDGTLSCTGSIFAESASRAITKTYCGKDIKEIAAEILELCGLENYSVKISGKVDYYRFTGSPLQALEELRQSAGFVVSSGPVGLTVAWLPERVKPQKELAGDIVEDLKRERISRVLWKDGLHEFDVGSGEGEALEVQSVFSASHDAFAKRVLSLHKYQSAYIALDCTLDPEIVHHSQVSIGKNNATLACLVNHYQKDWISGVARYECNTVE